MCTMPLIRVRPLLSILNAVERQELKRLLPPKLKAPEDPDSKYPAALLSAIAAVQPGSQYSVAGIVTERLIALAPIHITAERLITTVQEIVPEIQADKILKSKTSEPYLQHLRATRTKMRNAARGDLRHEEAIGTIVEGHPDFRTTTQIFEVKMTGQVLKNWQDFLFQVFAYAALAPEVTDIYLVLPLQEILWHHDVRTWTQRAAYRTFLETAATKKAAASGPAQALMESHSIGSHQPKLRSLVDTLQSLPTNCPSQIFLGGPQSSHHNISDEEITASAASASSINRSVFVHSPYIINLCTPGSTDILIQDIAYATLIGGRGVVVHVGKSTTQPLDLALKSMRTNLLTAMEHATTECPILLETPAGQGTEVLRTREEFVGFVTEINDPRLRICVDTCHVFACGHSPLEYIQQTPADLIKLIHFNDSAAICGSCVDRHALVGEGHIGLETMTAIAGYARAQAIPMIIE